MSPTAPAGSAARLAVLFEGWRLGGAGKSALLRTMTMPITMIMGFALTRLLVGAVGPSGFATYAIIAALPALLPMADVGLGAAVTDAVARRRATGLQHAWTITAVTTQLLSLASVVLLAVVASLAATGAWGDWLGIAASARPNLAAGVALTIFALTVPVSLGYRVLLGLEKNHVIVLAQALVSFGTLAMVVVLVVVRAPLWSLCATPMFSAWLVNAAACVYVRRELDMPWRALANIPRPYLPRLKSVFAIAIPMAMTVSALPIGLQTDRIVLVHVANIGEVARYSAGAQLFGACYSLLSFGGQSLWPVFARLRTEGLPGAGRRSLVGAMRSFAIGGGVLAVGLVVLGPWVSSLTTAGEAPASYGTMAAFGALLLAFALYWPVGMYCTDAPGLRLQAMATWGMAAANLPLSIIFARTWGAAGPALASAVTIVVFMCLPIGWRAWIASGAQLVATAADN